ncbi:ATP-dependent DNA helicase RecG [bacterium]|nr:ATP-dependent DNA helicase RecG [bacterium]
MFNPSENSDISKLFSFLSQPLESAVDLSKAQLKKITAALGGKVFDFLVGNLPESYETRFLVTKYSDFERGSIATFKAKVVSVKRGFGKIPSYLKVDMAGSLVTITFFGKLGMIYCNLYKEGDEVLVSGEVSPKSFAINLVNPEIFKFDEGWKTLLSGYIPIYKNIVGVSHLFMLRTAKMLVNTLSGHRGEWLPESLKKEFDFPDFVESLMNLHFPHLSADIDELNDFKTRWHKRIAFDQLFFFQFGSQFSAIGMRTDKNRRIKIESELSVSVEKNMAFELTMAQKRVLGEIRGDLSSIYPMNRLLQGDVGSGKTAVMVLASLDVIASGYKSVIMAPTEILAAQHYKTISSMVPENIKIELFLGGVTGKKKKAERLENAKKADFLIGTHALFENMEFMEDIGLIIIDEQHRFGVSQRMKLQSKSIHPDVLVVSATPIPRTLALTVYGSTEISVINEMPPGRIPVTTRLVKAENRFKVFDFVTEIIKNQNKKGYWVCPLVEESESEELKSEMKHVEGVYDEFSKVLGDKAALLHGRMKGEEKREIIDRLKNGEINLLVSTIVVEVGVDVPDAVFMVIENAERFGLAQLHQLRGRVGRGKEKSFCALIAGSEISDKAFNRLDFLSKTENGFKIAEYDLKTRGPGALTGLEQSGFKNDAYFLLAVRHGELVEKARIFTKNILASGDDEYIKFCNRVFELFFAERFNRFRAS